MHATQRSKSKRNPALLRAQGIYWLLGLVFGCVPAAEALAQEKARVGLSVWDTGKPAAKPLAAEVVAGKAGWKSIAVDAASPKFSGDIVIANNRILAVARQQGT